MLDRLTSPGERSSRLKSTSTSRNAKHNGQRKSARSATNDEIIAVVPRINGIKTVRPATIKPMIFPGWTEWIFMFLCMWVGEAFGHSIDEPQCKIFILSKKANIELVNEVKKRIAAAEELLEYKEQVSLQREEREKAAKLADSMLNHTLKNILADGIASVEIYEQTSKKNHLVCAKQSMKRGMTWTRRRQSLIMVCDGNYHLHEEIVCIKELVLKCVEGRQVTTDFTTLHLSCRVCIKVDPMLLRLAIENGISNAIKHNQPASPVPKIFVDIHNQNQVNLILIVQNVANA